MQLNFPEQLFSGRPVCKFHGGSSNSFIFLSSALSRTINPQPSFLYFCLSFSSPFSRVRLSITQRPERQCRSVWWTTQRLFLFYCQTILRVSWPRKKKPYNFFFLYSLIFLVTTSCFLLVVYFHPYFFCLSFLLYFFVHPRKRRIFCMFIL